MRLAFVSANADHSSTDATAWHKALPRPIRKALRVHTPKTKSATHDGVDSYFFQGYKVDTYHTQNLEYLDRPFDFDEFNDIDNELEGLTITEPMTDAELFAFCTGYDIL